LPSPRSQQSSGGSLEVFEAQPWPNQPLDALVILLDDVIQKLHLPEFGETPKRSIPLHGLQRDWISGILVNCDRPQIDCIPPPELLSTLATS
jgi:hypothetical protein